MEQTSGYDMLKIMLKVTFGGRGKWHMAEVSCHHKLLRSRDVTTGLVGGFVRA